VGPNDKFSWLSNENDSVIGYVVIKVILTVLAIGIAIGAVGSALVVRYLVK
jgi:hypothetical protein